MENGRLVALNQYGLNTGIRVCEPHSNKSATAEYIFKLLINVISKDS